MLLATGIATIVYLWVTRKRRYDSGIMPVTGIPLPFLSYGVGWIDHEYMLSIGILVKYRNATN